MPAEKHITNKNKIYHGHVYYGCNYGKLSILQLGVKHPGDVRGNESYNQWNYYIFTQGIQPLR